MYEEKEELVSIMKQAAKERLQLERQLAVAKPEPVSEDNVRFHPRDDHIYQSSSLTTDQNKVYSHIRHSQE